MQRTFNRSYVLWKENHPKTKVYTYWRIVCHSLLLILYTNLFTVIGRTMVQAVDRRPLVTGQWFIPSKVRIVFTVDRMTLGQFSPRVLRVYLVSVIPSMFLLSFITTSIQSKQLSASLHITLNFINFWIIFTFWFKNVRLEQENMVLGHTTTYKTLKTCITYILRTHYMPKYPWNREII
jgi:hypothetical protein